MKRWIIATCLVSACHADDPQTSVAEQGLNDCTPGGNYLGATLPKLDPWTGKTPAGKPGQVYLDYLDPRTKGVYLVFLVDPGVGENVWGAIVKESSIEQYRSSIPPFAPPRITDCCRPPPPPPGGGDNWKNAVARMNLEAALRVLELSDEAVAAAGFPKFDDPLDYKVSTPDLSTPGTFDPLKP